MATYVIFCITYTYTKNVYIGETLASKSAIFKEKVHTARSCRPFQRPGIVMSENYVLYVTVFSSTFFQEIQLLVELIELEGPNNALSFDGSIINFFYC